MTRAASIIGLAGALTACATSSPPADVALEGLALTRVDPGLVIPGSELRIEGDSFVAAEWGGTSLRLRGRTGGPAGHRARRSADGGRELDLAIPARFLDYDHLAVSVDDALIDAVGGDVGFTGEATVEVESVVDGEVHRSAPLALTLRFQRGLTPRPASVTSETVAFVNDPIEVAGEGFLLGGPEGSTVAVVTGCVTRGGTCDPIGPIELPLTPAAAFDRDHGSFPLAPSVVGIDPGRFTGEVVLENHHRDGRVIAASPCPITYDLLAPAVFRASPAASLGQYVVVEGGGFVGGEPGAVTQLRLLGTFTRTGRAKDAPAPPLDVDPLLIPELVGGRTVRYVVSLDDALGRLLDLRRDTGVFEGRILPITRWGGRQVSGTAAEIKLEIAPIKQVVYLDFRPSYVEALRGFGLRAVDREIRDRVLDVVRAAYPAINLELRTEPPTDFALYSHVEIGGEDPNGLGLFGYDNSPGKDNGNLRLYDRLGGVNARTQQDGFPGYGGVFVTSLMSFSQHPAVGGSVAGADPRFDAIFDPFRPDRGDIVVGADLAGVPRLTTSAACPAADRPTRIGCAVWVMGSLIGTTLAHEIGHSLGLANPYSEGFHDAGDVPDRLMDGGAERPFAERAELDGQGPARFCEEEYAYLRDILPTREPADTVPRPSCQ